MAPFAVQMNIGSRVPTAENACARLPRVRRAGLAALFLLGAAACRQQPLPEGTAAERDVAAGRRIFERKCASCHNTNGDGKTIVAGHFPHANLIDGIWRSDGSPAAIEAQIRHGHDPMPKFEGKLTDEEIRQTVAYVVVLSQQATPPPPAAAAGKP
jgi:mono/diheme cytochrome c family protein